MTDNNNLLHSQETDRLAALQGMNILDTPSEERFDTITKEALRLLRVPISTISILDKDREWFKSCQGLEQKEGDRKVAFCAHALLAKDLFVVEDTLLDERFKNNPYVTGEPFIRFYAGQALLERKSALPVGVFCIKDIKPRTLSLDELAIFIDLATRAEVELNS